jgi:uridine kinase
MVTPARIEISVSTWRQRMPPEPSHARAVVLDRLAASVDALGSRRTRIGIDGLTAAGKTSLGHDLARTLARRGRPVLRASLDDFKHPWRARHLRDRESGEGYYRNAFDLEAARRLLLDPSGPDGGVVALCSIDPLTQIDHSATTVAVPDHAALVVDGVFAFRPEINAYWDLRIWVEVDPEVSVRRGVARDAGIDGGAAAAEALHRERYLAGELLYVAEVDPRAAADVIVDNTDFDCPRLVTPSEM